VRASRPPCQAASFTRGSGISNCCIIPTCIVWRRPVGCLPIGRGGFRRGPVSSYPCGFSAGYFEGSSWPDYGDCTPPVNSGFHGSLARLSNPAAFAAMLRGLFFSDWVVYSKRPFGGAEQALRYLGCYTHRVAISNHRLVALENGEVVFRWRDSAHKNKKRLMGCNSTNSSDASYCTCCRRASCASATSGSSLIGGRRCCCRSVVQY
jgi:hypothetical protein